MSFEPDGIAIHHSAGTDTDEDNWKGIKRYHSKKWSTDTTGYHWLIEEVGPYFDAFNPRSEGSKGIHVKGHNSNYIGFCFVGDYSKSTPGRLHLEVGAREIARCMLRNYIAFSNIKRHDEICEPGHTSCPGDAFPMDKLKDMIRRYYIRCVSAQDEWPVHIQQQTLNMLGIDAGPVDNLEGDKTRSGRKNASESLTGVDTTHDWNKKLRAAVIMELKLKFLKSGQGVQGELQKDVRSLLDAVNELNQKADVVRGQLDNDE